MSPRAQVSKTLSNPTDLEEILLRLSRLSPQDKGLWGRMTVHEAVCHMHDSYLIALGEKRAEPALSKMPGLLKRLALYTPMRWPKGVPTRPEVEQGKGGTPPGDFVTDLALLRTTCTRFCADLPDPSLAHPIFGSMTTKDWMRWGYLHADHHLRQFDR